MAGTRENMISESSTNEQDQKESRSVEEKIGWETAKDPQ